MVLEALNTLTKRMCVDRMILKLGSTPLVTICIPPPMIKCEIPCAAHRILNPNDCGFIGTRPFDNIEPETLPFFSGQLELR